MVAVLLLRHAESVWNAEGRWQGHADPPLSDAGLEQARSVAPHLPEVTFIASSDLRRAHQTAATLASHLGISSVELRRGLRERDVGSWSGLTNVEIDERWPGLRGSGISPDGWEGDSALLERVTRDLVQFAAGGTPGPVLVVTHGGVITLLETYLGAADGEPVGNLEGRWISINADGAMALGGRLALRRST